MYVKISNKWAIYFFMILIATNNQPRNLQLLQSIASTVLLRTKISVFHLKNLIKVKSTPF